MADPGVGEVADRLYGGSPDDFMTTRTEAVATAKKTGDKELAKQIGALRKPTRSAWLVNLLARSAADELDELLDLGAALREAQESLEAASLRTLSRERNRAVDALSRRATGLGAEAGYDATETVRQEVAQTLQAALADPDTADLVRRGVLHQSVNYGGFGTFELAAAAGSKPKEKPADDGDTSDPEAEARAAARTRAWEQAKDELATAEADAERETADANTLDEQVAELRQRLEEAETAAAEARRSAEQAQQRVDDLAAAERAARPH